MTAPYQNNIYGQNGNTTSIVDRYSITCTGLPLTVPLSQGYTRVELLNSSTWGLLPLTPVMQSAWWNNSLPQGAAYITENVASTATLQNTTTASNGIYMLNTAYPLVYPVVTGGTSITAANPAVATIANTFVNGQTIRLTNVVGMSQINGMEFTISGVSPTGFTIPFLNSSGFASPATSFSAQVVTPPSVVTTPAINFITAISSVGTSTTITLAYAHNFFVNGTVWLTIPSYFGMQGLDLAVAGIPNPYIITAVNTTLNTITLQVNSSSFSPFTFPTSAFAISNHITPAQVNPYGQAPNIYNPNTTEQNAIWYLGLGSAVCGALGNLLFADCYAEGIINTFPNTSVY
jgi:hypothetical protein